MKTIGLIGGMSWESTATYYKLINQGINQRLGGLSSAEILLHSVDFAPYAKLQHTNEWTEITQRLTNIAVKLEKAGADCIVIGTNTMHKVAKEIEASINIPLLHIADGTAEVIKYQNLTCVGLLGTSFTMEQDFYKDVLKRHGIEPIVPQKTERDLIHNVIFNELCQGKINNTSREQFINIIGQLKQNGAQGIILGCTEIAHLIKDTPSNIPLFDTTKIHVEKVIEWALEQ